MKCKVEVRYTNRVAIVAPKGTYRNKEHWEAIDVAVEEVVEGGGMNILFDLRDAVLPGNYAVGRLVRWFTGLRNDGKTVKFLLDRKQQWVAFFEVARLHEIIETYADEQEALQSFQ